MQQRLQQTLTSSLIVLLFLSMVTPAAAIPSAESTAPTITAHTTFDRTPDTPGSVTGTVDYDLPSEVTEFEIQKPTRSSITVTDTENLVETEDGYEWTGVGTPELTYQIEVPSDQMDAQGYGVDTGDWALVRNHGFYVTWRYQGTAPEYTTTASVAGDGIAGNGYVYLGEYTATTERVDNREIVVVAPDNVTTNVDTEQLFDDYRFTAQTLWIRGDYDQSLAVVIPSDIPTTAAGRAAESDFYVQNTYTLDQPGSVWLHEYIHTGQQRMGSDMEWFTEASAEYYSTTTSLNRGELDASSYRQAVQITQDEDAVLTEKPTWENNRVEYQKGKQVLAALDAQIQHETGGEKSLRDVYRAVQTQSGEVTYSDFRAILREEAGPETAAWADTYIDGQGLPPIDHSIHVHLYESVDADNDGLVNEREKELQTNPLAEDTDGDGVPDKTEIEHGLNPRVSDTDGDGVNDGVERQIGTNATDRDSDGDLFPDGVERRLTTEPASANSLGELLTALKENAY